MSFISSLKNIAVVGSLAAAVATLSVPAQATGFKTHQDHVNYCTDYATLAQYAVNDNKYYKCGNTGPAWGDTYAGHFNWCMGQGDFIQTGRETKKRRVAITQCHMCDKLLNSDKAFQVEYTKNRCENVLPPAQRSLAGRVWTNNRACKAGLTTQTMVDNIKSAQQEAIKGCKSRNASESKPKTKSLTSILGTKGFSQSFAKSIAPDRNIELTSAKIDPTVEDDSVVVVDTSEPAPKQRTQVIVIGNRYAEVPAFDEPQDEGSGLGTVVKAGAAAVVVGTAAVATGVVAAKVLDYADDYKGGINKSMSGAAAALKEKLKNGGGGFYKVATSVKEKIKDSVAASGGGINKSMSGAAAAMKEKVKDQFSGGGINKSMSGAAAALKDKLKERAASGGGITKAMSGAKEALKYKLKERAAGGGLVSKAASGFKEKVKSRLTGGGGGLMKGMAKAGGGLMRGLLRR